MISVKIDKYRLVIRYILGTTEQRWSYFPLNLNYISSPFHILGRIAQYFWMVRESFSVESCSLQDEVRYIDTSDLSFPFFDSPFSSKGKRRKRGWRIEADDWPTRPIFSSLNKQSCIWHNCPSLGSSALDLHLLSWVRGTVWPIIHPTFILPVLSMGNIKDRWQVSILQ